MKRNRLGFPLTLLFSVFALPLLGQVNDTYVVPVVGDTPGGAGTRWATELHVFNPQAHKLTVTAVFLPTGGGAGSSVDFDVAANSTAFSENVVSEVFRTTGTGSLLLATFPENNPGVPNDIVSLSFLVNTKTFNNAGSGTYGQSIPGVWAGLQNDGITAIANGVRNFGVVSLTGYRTNIGAVNLGDFSATLRVSVYDDEGRTLLNGAPFTLPPQGHIQDRLPVEVDHGSVEFWVEGSDPVVFAYASVVDNRSGDGAYINPILLATTSVVYPKTASLTDLGFKINTEIARRVAAKATHLGKVSIPR